MEFFGLYSEVDGEWVIIVQAKDKSHALELINKTGGYQNEPFCPDIDYKIKKCKNWNRNWYFGTELIDGENRMSVADFVKTFFN